MEVRLYLQMLQRGWWIVVLSALSALGIALVASYVSTPIYLATARFVVSPAAAVSGGPSVIDSLNVLDKRSIVTTYAEVLNSDTIFGQTVTGLQLSPEAVKKAYVRTTVVLPEANVLELSIEGPDPGVTAMLANGVGQQAISYIEGLNQGYNIRVLDPAIVAVEPIRPRPLRDASLALVLGVFAGAALAIIRAQLLIPIEAFIRRSTLDADSNVQNRRFFEQRLEEILARSVDGSHALGLVHLEGLRGFVGNVPKPIEQQVLRKATAVLQNELRGNDILGRWDGTTFGILLPDTPDQAAVRTLGRIQIALSRPFTFGEGETLHLSPYIGVAVRQLGEPSGTLTEWAETALKQSTAGESRLVLYKMSPFSVS